MRRGGLVLAVVLALAALSGAAAPTAGDLGDGALQTGDVDPDAVVLRADVTAEGDAVWTVEYRVRLDDENTTAAFESLAADIRANESRYRDRFARRIAGTVAAAENATGREMAVENVSVRARTQSFGQEFGVVTYRFRWTGFAAVEGDRVIVGDALSGFFLDRETRLVVAWPAGYEVRQVSPEPSERRETAVVWEGPVDFAGGQPRVVVAPASPLPAPWIAVVAGVLVLVAAGLAWWVRRDGQVPVDVGVGEGDADADAAESDGVTAPTDAAGGPDGGDGGNETEPPEELLSPEERVLRLLRERGGRMKQAEITETFDWSAARTSQVVGSLREDGELESFRLGRENVLRLPEDDGEDTGEP